MLIVLWISDCVTCDCHFTLTTHTKAAGHFKIHLSSQISRQDRKDQRRAAVNVPLASIRFDTLNKQHLSQLTVHQLPSKMSLKSHRLVLDNELCVTRSTNWIFGCSKNNLLAF